MSALAQELAGSLALFLGRALGGLGLGGLRLGDAALEAFRLLFGGLGDFTALALGGSFLGPGLAAGSGLLRALLRGRGCVAVLFHFSRFGHKYSSQFSVLGSWFLVLVPGHPSLLVALSAPCRVLSQPSGWESRV